MQFSASLFGRIIFSFLIVVCAEKVPGQSYQKRLALVMGNSNYQNGDVLPTGDDFFLNSKNDLAGKEQRKKENPANETYLNFRKETLK